MTGSLEERQARIDKLIEETQLEKLPTERRLLGIAAIGMETPEALTSSEMKQVCSALVTHYHQMGIS